MLTAKQLELLVEARQASGLSQAALADRLGVARATINRVEQGRRELDLSLLEAWCTAVGLRCNLSIDLWSPTSTATASR